MLFIRCHGFTSSKGPRSFLPSEGCTLSLCGRLCYLAGQNERKAFKDLLPQDYCCRVGGSEERREGEFGFLRTFYPNEIQIRTAWPHLFLRLRRGCTNMIHLRSEVANSDCGPYGPITFLQIVNENLQNI